MEFLRNITSGFFPSQEGFLFQWMILVLLMLGIHAVLTGRTARLTQVKIAILMVGGITLFWVLPMFYGGLGSPDRAMAGAIVAGSIRALLVMGFLGALTFTVIYVLEIIRPQNRSSRIELLNRGSFP